MFVSALPIRQVFQNSFSVANPASGQQAVVPQNVGANQYIALWGYRMTLSGDSHLAAAGYLNLTLAYGTTGGATTVAGVLDVIWLPAAAPAAPLALAYDSGWAHFPAPYIDSQFQVANFNDPLGVTFDVAVTGSFTCIMLWSFLEAG